MAGAGGLRISPRGGLSFVPPPLITLVLAVLLLGVMARAGLLIPGGLLGDHRTGLENASGTVVGLSLFAASAQLFTCLTPDAGVLRLVFNLFFLFLLWNTLAAQPDRTRLLRSLLVVFGWAYVVRYVALAALSRSAGGLDAPPADGAPGRRDLRAADRRRGDGAAGRLRELSPPWSLYMIGLVLLPRPPAAGDGGHGRDARARRPG